MRSILSTGVAAVMLVLALSLLCVQADEPVKKETVGPEADAWNKTVDKGVAYLKKNQSRDGSWSGDKNPGVTGIVLTGMLQTGTVTAVSTTTYSTGNGGSSHRSAGTSVSCFVSTLVELNATSRFKEALNRRGSALARRTASAVQ